MMERIEKLYMQLARTDRRNFYQIETDFFMMFYQIPEEERLDCMTAFMTISNWMGISMRSGVWTFYEGAAKQELEVALRFLEQTGWEEAGQMFEYGIHDYQNPVYQENCNYPEIWMEEAELIDKWIAEREDQIYEWLIKLLENHKEEICRFFIENSEGDEKST